MNSLGTIGMLLHHKGSAVWSVSPDITVFDAIKMLSEKNIGALLVTEADKLVGIFSERDYTRKIALEGRNSRETRVREIISSPVYSITPRNTIEDGMRLMRDKRVRHLPVLDAGKVVGVISIGDLVNWIISAQTAALDQMESYIAGR